MKIKICGLTRLQDIEAVNAVCPDYIGFVFAPSRRQVTLEQACELRAALHGSMSKNPAPILLGCQKKITPVGVFVDASIDTILAAVNAGAIDAVQLHGAEDEVFIVALRAALDASACMPPLDTSACKTMLDAPSHFVPHVPVHTPIIKAISVSKKGDAAVWKNSVADFLLLDHKSGGTGEAFDWGLIGDVKKPFFLAGGLSPQNAAEACTIVPHPYALDVSSGVESAPGVKCSGMIMEFVRVVRMRYNHQRD